MNLIKKISTSDNDLKRAILLVLLIVFTVNILTGQNRREEPPPFKDRLFYGGSFGLQLGTVTDIELSPVIGFWVLPRIAVAVGPDFRFYKYRDTRTNIFGGRTYAQLVIFRDIDKIVPLGIHTSIFLHLEDEVLSLESEAWNKPTSISKRFSVNTLLGGIGMSQQIGVRSSMNFMVLWTLTDSDFDLYGNPEIRIGFIF